MKIYIDSACDIHYSSFYIKGLQETFGKKTIQFTSKYFKQFQHNNHFFAFVIKQNNRLYNIIIDFTDEDAIDEIAYNWCNVYGKVNVNPDKNVYLNKVKAIGPSFGICIYSKYETVLRAFINLLNGYSRIPNKRKFLSDYKAQLHRPRIESYFSFVAQKKGYVYFVSSLWKKEMKTNTFRANFIRAAKSHTGISFEGGFAPRTKNDVKGFEDLTIKTRESITDYMLKTKQSIIAFNTPAVLDCHGWKLAEFLAHGKAILSTTLSRKLSSDLVDGQHLLITDGSVEDIKSKLDLLLNNPKMQQQLEEQSRNYFNEYLAPKKVIKILLEDIENSKVF